MTAEKKTLALMVKAKRDPGIKHLRQQMEWFREDTSREFVRSATIKEYWEHGGKRFMVPPVQHDGPEWTIRQFTVEDNDATALRAMFQGRYTAPGTYTQLILKRMTLEAVRAGDPFAASTIMMTDSPAEVWDHREPYVKAQELKAKSALVVGLGIGMVTRMLMSLPHIERIDVLEISKELVDFFDGSFDDRVTIHHGDVFKKRWGAKKQWDVVWIDIWPFISEQNEKEMKRLGRKYEKRCKWLGWWSKHELMYQRAKTNEWKARAKARGKER